MKDKTIFGNNKILQHLSNIVEYKRDGVTAPVTVEIDMTDYCNHKCPMCVGGVQRKKSKLSLEESVDYLGQMKDYGVKAVIFTGGGEPLVNKATLPAMQYAKRVGLDVGLITNGGLLNKDNIEGIVNNATWCRVSLDGITPETFKKTHGMGEGEFYNVLQNIVCLGSKKVDKGKDLTVGVGYLTGKLTVDGMVPAAKLLSGCNVDYLQFRPFHNDYLDVREQIEECKKYETDSFKVLASTQKYAHFDESLDGKVRPYKECHGVGFTGVVQADGRMTLCCHTRGRPEYNLGSLKEQSFKSVWEGDRKKEIVKSLDLKSCGPYFCRCDGFNRTLDDLMTDKQHVNFL